MKQIRFSELVTRNRRMTNIISSKNSSASVKDSWRSDDKNGLFTPDFVPTLMELGISPAEYAIHCARERKVEK